MMMCRIAPGSPILFSFIIIIIIVGCKGYDAVSYFSNREKILWFYCLCKYASVAFIRVHVKKPHYNRSKMIFV